MMARGTAIDPRRLRLRMVRELAARGITDGRVLDAMSRVPRHLFVPEGLRSRAYEDCPLPIGYGQTISQPSTVALMSQMLETSPGMRVLEVGTGSGYQAAVLAAMGCTVYTVERLKELYQSARALLQQLDLRAIHMQRSDGTLGMPAAAPFDRIIVTAGGPQIPRPLLEQLAVDGIMLIPVGARPRTQRLMRIMRRQGRLCSEDLGPAVFGRPWLVSPPVVIPCKGDIMSSCSSCSSASGCSSKGNPGGAGCMESAMARQDQIIADRLAHIRHKIFVMSGKGGVGKSSVTVNTAAALAHRGFKVGILDVDMHGPSVPNLLGLKATIEMNEKNELIPAMYNENLAVISMDSFLQDRDQAILWRGPKKTAAIRQFLSDVAWGPLDFLLIDSPPGTGDEHMTILKTITDAQSVTVTTPQEISLADVRKAVNFLQVAEGKVLGVVENMSGLVCPHCHQEIDLFKKGGGEELAKHYGIPFLGAIPLDPATVVAADRGVPVVYLEQDCPAKQAFLHLADAIAQAADSGAAKLVSKS